MMSPGTVRTYRINFTTRLLGHRNATIGAFIIFVFVVIALLAPILAPQDPYENDLSARLAPVSREHLLGADFLGRDILSRMLYGSRISLEVGIIVGVVSLLVGFVIGMVAGYFGGLIDNVMMRVVDALLAFPGILLAIAVVAALGPGLYNVMIALAINSSPIFARVARASTLTVKSQEYVAWSVSAAGSRYWIITRHVLPNIAAPMVVLFSIRVGTAILTSASLSFLGLGVRPPAPEWGAMLSEARNYLFAAPHLAAAPGLAIMLVVLGFNLFGDGLRDALDPKL